MSEEHIERNPELRFLWRLDGVPDLLAYMRRRLNVLTAYQFDKVGYGGTSDKRRAPLSVTVLDDLDELWDGLAAFAQHLAEACSEELHLDLPGMQGAAGIIGRPQGEPDAWATAAQQLVDWIRVRSWLVAETGLLDEADQLGDLVGKLLGRYDRAPRLRPMAAHRCCPECGAKAVGVSWVGGLMVIGCAKCPWHIDPATPGFQVLERTYTAIIEQALHLGEYALDQ
jgi:hypothetical protein